MGRHGMQTPARVRATAPIPSGSHTGQKNRAPRPTGSRRLRQFLASTLATIVAAGLAASLAIPSAFASDDPSAVHHVTTASSRSSQAFTVVRDAQQQIVVRDGSQIIHATRSAGTSIPAVNGWTVPVHRPITSPWGPRQVICTSGVGCDSGFHHGNDFAGPCGTPFYAVSGGVVSAITRGGLAGDEIIIDHGDGISTAYSHMFDDGILVAQGEKVTAGQNIGLFGSSGDSTGCHLYFEYRIDNVTVDPAQAMASHGVVLGQ